MKRSAASSRLLCLSSPRRNLSIATPRLPCTFCNKCLVHVLEDPLGCYELSRYESYEDMMKQLMSFFEESEW